MLRLSSAPMMSPQWMKDILSNTGMLVSVVGLVMSLLLAFAPGGPATDTPGDEDDPGVVAPGPDDQAELAVICDEIAGAIMALRVQEPTTPVIPDPHLSAAAQRWAEKNAVSGRQENSPANVTMLQHNLLVGQASSHAFMEAWLASEPHTAVLLDARYSFLGVGVATGHDRVWVTVQLSAH